MVFFDNVIFYPVNDLSTLVSDAKIALLPCDFKSSVPYAYATRYR